MYEKEWEIFSFPAGPVNVSSLSRMPKKTETEGSKFIVPSALRPMIDLALLWASVVTSERSKV